MTLAAKALLDQIRTRSDNERELISIRLQSMLNPGDYDPLDDEGFRVELDRRIASVGDGSIKLIDGDGAFEFARLDLERRRMERKRL